MSELAGRKQQGCNEECLRRIAARLCVLNDCPQPTQDNDAPADDCCAPRSDALGGRSSKTSAVRGSGGKARAETYQAENQTSKTADGGCCPRISNQESDTSVTASPVGRMEDCCSTSKCGRTVDTGSDGAACATAAAVAECAATRSNSVKCCAPEPVTVPTIGDNCCKSASSVTVVQSCCKPKGQSSARGSCCKPVSIAVAGVPESSCSGGPPGTQTESHISIGPSRCNENDKLTACCEGSADADKKSICSQAIDKASSDCADDCCQVLDSGKASARCADAICADKCCTDKDQARVSEPSASCFDHLQAAMDRYEAVLKRGLCLCRMVIDQLGFNCCAPDTSLAHAEEHSALVTSNAKHGNGDEAITSTEVEIHPRCSSDAPKNELSQAAPLLSHQGDPDVEKYSSREHVVLNVTGMTCTGCSKKMMNVLGAIPGLSKAQVTFVSGTAEFELDTSTSGPTEKVLVRIEKETGFKCFRIISGRQELSVLMTADTARVLKDASLAGLMSIQQGKKGHYTVTYDPTIIGARSLLPPSAELTPPSDAAGIAEGKRRLVETALSTSLAAILTIPVVVLEWSSNPIPEQTVSIITLVLGTCVQIIAVPEFYVGALKSLMFSHVIEMDMLVVISITAAYAYSVVAFGLQRSGVKLEQDAFFETSTMLITLVLLGRLIAAWARMRAVSAISMRSLQAETATLVSDNASTEEIDARLLQFGDTVLIGPHSRIVTDGQIVHGASEVDESMITGESLPAAKQPGDNVIAGTFNGSGSLHVAISRLPGENSITEIATLVENAVAAKPKVQELADRVASWFIPAVVGIALVVFFIWIAIAIEIRNRNAGGAIGLSVTYAIAILAISCPCSLGLAVPMVLVIAGGIAARSGVIIKAADAIETSYKITDIIFDKTGTLTEGDLHVVLEESNFERRLDIDEVRSLVYAMIEGNAHPVSVSIAAYLKERNLSPLKPPLQSVTSIPGAGLEARFGDLCVKAGNPNWLGLQERAEVSKHLAKAMTLLCVTLDGKLVTIYGLKSTLRANAGSVLAELAQRNITCHIVSGDNSSACLDIASVLNVAHGNVLSCSSPAQKQKYVQDLQGRGKKVLFLGDGTNDAVAIAQADVGVQMGSASDVTGAVADVVLLSRNLESLLALLDLSRSAVRRIVFNFAWSAIYNVFAILLASGAFVKFRIPPAYAGLGEIVSVLPVIIAAATLAIGRNKVA